jgi:hypothetical protein
MLEGPRRWAQTAASPENSFPQDHRQDAPALFTAKGIFECLSPRSAEHSFVFQKAIGFVPDAMPGHRA